MQSLLQAHIKEGYSMTIATSTIVGFFIAGIVPLMFIIGGLYKLRRIHKYPLIAIVLGFAVYFLSGQFLTSMSYSLLTSIPAVNDYLTSRDHILVYYLVISLLPSLFLAPIAYLFLSWLRRGKWTIYDAIAAGISYWIYNAVSLAFGYANEARISTMVNNGTVYTLVSETVTREEIDGYLKILQTADIWQCLLEVLDFLLLALTVIFVFVLTYHAMKRKKFAFALLGMAIQFAVLFTSDYCSIMLPTWGYAIVLFLDIAAVGAGLYLYYRWYTNQRMILTQQRNEFKARKHAEYLEKIAAKEAEAKEAAAPEAKKAAESASIPAAGSENPAADSVNSAADSVNTSADSVNPADNSDNL